MGFKLFLAGLIFFIIINIIIAIFRPKIYKNHLDLIRKCYYSFIIISVLVGLIAEETSINNWTFLLALAGIVIFIDIGVFLTPAISKFFQAEFVYQAESLAELGEQTIEKFVIRASYMSYLIQHSETELWLEEEEDVYSLISLDEFLKKYADRFGFKVHIFELHTEVTGLLTADMLREDEITTKLEDFQYLYNVKESDTWKNSLLNSTIVSTPDESFFVVPVYMEQRDLLLALLQDKGELTTVDPIHITNLVYLYYESAAIPE